MNGGFNTSGFTIIETLIVLGVTAILLFSVLLLVGGKTSQAQFASGINSVKTNLQQIIDTASNGSYPNKGNFTCSLSGGAISLGYSVGSSQQGSNYGCTFIGSMIIFSKYSQPSGANQSYTIHTIVGQQCTSTSYTTSFSTCQLPTAQDFSDTDPYALPSQTGTQSSQTLLSGISLVSTTLTNSAGTTVTYSSPTTPPGVAFLVNPAQQASAISPSVNLSPGALQLSLYSYTSGCPTSGALFPTAQSCSLTAENQIALCFASSTTDQSGLVSLGGGGLQSTVSLKIFGGNNCNGL